MSHQPNGGVTLNGTLLPDDVVPNHTDPANTASNGPAALNEQTLGDYRSERSITRERAEEARPYDLVILSSFGGPEGQEDVIPFLRNVTAGRGIPDERLEEVATHYRANGGVSPINEQNRALLAALQQALAERGPHIPITWANRNWKPYVKDVLAEAYENGHRNVLVLATSAYPGYSSCRQYREDYGVAIEQLGLEGHVHVGKIRQFFDVPGFSRAFADGLKDGLATVREQLAARDSGSLNPRLRIMFCTHSVPTSAANEAGPRGVNYEGGSAYVEKHLQVARAVLSLVRDEAPQLLQNVEWELVYQSRSGHAVARAGRQRRPGGAAHPRQPGGGWRSPRGRRRAGAPRIRLRPHGSQVGFGHRGAGHLPAPGRGRRAHPHPRHAPGVRGVAAPPD